MKKKPFNVISAIFLAVLGVIRSHLFATKAHC